MERHASQPKELNASVKIAPYGWDPVADGENQNPYVQLLRTI